MTRERVSARHLVALREQITRRDLAILEQIGELRLMTGKQIGAVHFPVKPGSDAQVAARTCRRTMERLARDSLVLRLARRIGGVRSGSSSFIFTLGPVGQRLLGLGGPRRRFREPSSIFADHTLAITQLVVDLIVASRQGHFDLLAVEPEPTCWRSFPGVGTRQILRPDLFVSLGVGEFEHRLFLEIDRGTEHVPTLLRKCRTYDAYYRSGKEQKHHEVFPKVWWIVPDDRRRGQLASAIKGDRRLTENVFDVAITEDAIRRLAGGAP